MDGPHLTDCDILIAGHSHIAALGVPLSADGEGVVVPIPDAPAGICGFSGQWSGNRTGAYWRALAAASEGRTVVLLWSGNEHNASFLLRDPVPFDLVLDQPGLAETERGALVVPRGLIAASFESALRDLESSVGLLVASGARRVIVLETPPPKRDLDSLRGVVLQSEFWRERCAALGQSPDLPDFSPARLRLKLWSVLMDTVRALAIAAGGETLRLPGDVLDADGFLLPQYWAPDLTHANAAYGRRVVAFLAEQLRVAA